MSVPQNPRRVWIQDASRQCWWQFEQPVRVVSARTVDQVPIVLAEVQQGVEAGLIAAGFVSYEAAPAFDESFCVHPESDFPLAWFGLYETAAVVSLPEATMELPGLDWQPAIAKADYEAAIAEIKQAIAAGMTYQVNFSLRLTAEFQCDPWVYFVQLMRSQPGQHGAYIELEDWAICCASPELFFEWRDGGVTTRPMKGTTARGLTVEGDRALAIGLRHSEKNQAENLMIVDMIRNDLGRIADLGSVTVTNLFAIEQYPTVWQMTSTVTAKTTATFPEMFTALFPCASITGAPKASTMRIIRDLEATPRRIYTGTIGWMMRDRAQFNVAIRTVLVDQQQQRAEYGVGGGIVWDSDAIDEYEECCTKAKILTHSRPDFSLLETLLWEPESGYFLLDLHIQRLHNSAQYFGFAIADVATSLHELSKTFPNSPHRVRLTMTKFGTIEITTTRIEAIAQPNPVKIRLAAHPVDVSNVFLYHKTTHRAVYETAKQSVSACDDVLLWNDRGELTESCIANLVVKLDGIYYTPPVSCGLLAGTFRESLLRSHTLQERIIQVEELSACSEIFLINSVRKWRSAIVVDDGFGNDLGLSATT